MSESVERRIAEIGRHADRTNRRRALELAEAVRLAAAGELSAAQRDRARLLAHQVLGSAGTFGHPQASRPAARLEEFFAAGDHDSLAQLHRARGAVADLRSEFGLPAEPEQG